MRELTITCDICNNELVPLWEDNNGAFNVHGYGAGVGHYDLCGTCTADILEVIKLFINKNDKMD